jgi:hypothetical protein
MVDEEHIGVNAIMGSKKRKGAGGEDNAAAPAAKEPKVSVGVACEGEGEGEEGGEVGAGGGERVTMQRGAGMAVMQ